MMAAHGVPPSGNPFIDQQHARLSELIQLAALEARDTASPSAFNQALALFRQELARHFAVEMVIVRGAGFDAASHHDAAHAAILRHLDGIMGRCAGQTTVPERHRLLDELERILLDHEMLEDAAFWDAVRAHSASSSLKWTELMAIGIDWVDDHHHRLVALLNRLSETANARDHASGADLLQQFLRLAREHFAAEEKHLEAVCKPPSRDRAAHARMLGELDGLAAGGHAPHVLVDHYLRFWMMEHILGLDRLDLMPAVR